jgi:hypothetical protein
MRRIVPAMLGIAVALAGALRPSRAAAQSYGFAVVRDHWRPPSLESGSNVGFDLRQRGADPRYVRPYGSLQLMVWHAGGGLSGIAGFTGGVMASPLGARRGAWPYATAALACLGTIGGGTLSCSPIVGLGITWNSSDDSHTGAVEPFVDYGYYTRGQGARQTLTFGIWFSL